MQATRDACNSFPVQRPTPFNSQIVGSSGKVRFMCQYRCHVSVLIRHQVHCGTATYLSQRSDCGHCPSLESRANWRLARIPASPLAAAGTNLPVMKTDDVPPDVPPASLNPEKDPDEWVTKDEPMTGPQRSYLQTLCREAAEEFNENWTKAEASKKIDELQQKTGRGKNDTADT